MAVTDLRRPRRQRGSAGAAAPTVPRGGPADAQSAWIALVYFAALGVLTIVGTLGFVRGVPIGNLTRDPANTLEFPWYFGAVSYLGILMWCATATMCLFTVAVLRGRPEAAARCSFVLGAGLLTGLLMLDDLFLFHEVVFPYVLHYPEWALYGTYAAIVLFLMRAGWPSLRSTPYPVLMAACVLLGLSTVSDTLTNTADDVSLKFFVEDGFKFLGISSWFAYFSSVSLEWTRAAPGHSHATIRVA